MSKDLLLLLVVVVAIVTVLGVAVLEVTESEREAAGIHFIVGPLHE